MTVSSQPIEAASGGIGVLSLLNLGQIGIESFWEWVKNGFPFFDDATANMTNTKVLEICANGESEASNFESFGVNCSLNKVLVFIDDMRDADDANNTELIHLDSTPTQYTIENYPINLKGAFGWLSEEGITICGGIETKDCYTLKDSQWKQWPSMTTSRAYASTIKINVTQTLILGRRDEDFDQLSSTEMVNSVGAIKHKDLPWTLSFSYILKINETTGFITGGMQDGGWSPETHFVNLQTLDVTSGPRMQTERWNHGCANFHFGGKTYALVAGGWGLDSTEILDLEQSHPTWTVGPKLPRRLAGPTLVETSQG